MRKSYDHRLLHIDTFKKTLSTILNTYEYDAFLSFAIEDKIEVANVLYSKLEERGLKIWYSGRELIIGTNIEDKIREGLDQSEFGILLITPNYFQARWAIRELGALWAKERGDKKVIIPVFHDITPEEVGRYEPSLSGRWGVRTENGLDTVAEQIVNHIRGGAINMPPPSNINTGKGRLKNIASIALAIVCLILLSSAVWYYTRTDFSDELVIATIEERIENFEQTVEQEHAELIKLGATGADQQAVLSFLERFKDLDSQYRNYYFFTNGYQDWEFEKNVSPASGVDFDAWQSSDDYGFKHPVISELSQGVGNKKDVAFIYFNTQPVSYEVLSENEEGDRMVITVAYEQAIRLANFHFEYGPQTSYRKHTTYSLFGFRPEEGYVFEKKRGKWQFVTVQ